MTRKPYFLALTLLFASCDSFHNPFVAAVNSAPATVPADPVLDKFHLIDTLNAKFALPEGTGGQHFTFVPRGNRELAFRVPHLIIFTEGQGGLICADVSTPACTACVYLLGGHITAWQPTGQDPVLFLSSKSAFEVGKPIRGGIPICFPWFATKADGPLANITGTGGASPTPAPPLHGTARLTEWQVEETKDLGNGTVSITLLTHSDAATKVYLPGDYELREHITFGKELTVQLEVKNTGTTPFTYEEDLHAYLAVGDARKTSVAGLDNTDYLDKVDAKKQKHQSGPITFTAETDRIYLNTKTPLVLTDDSLNRKITVEKINSQTSVIWNPSPSKAIPDLGDGQWSQYVALETANAGDAAITLKPNESHTTSAIISVSK